MTDKQENKHSRNKRLKLFLSNNSVWTTNVPFSNQATKLGTEITAVETLMQVQGQNRTGIAVDKHDSQKTAVDKVMVLVGAMKAYAIDSGNDTLKREVDYSRSDLLGLRDTVCKTKLDELIALATANIGAAGSYGYVNGDVTAATAANVVYDAYIPKPQGGIDERANATAAIPVHLDNADKAIEVMTSMMEGFRAAHADFVTGFLQAKEIIDNRGSGGGTPVDGGGGGVPPTP